MRVCLLWGRTLPVEKAGIGKIDNISDQICNIWLSWDYKTRLYSTFRYHRYGYVCGRSAVSCLIISSEQWAYYLHNQSAHWQVLSILATGKRSSSWASALPLALHEKPSMHWSELWDTKEDMLVYVLALYWHRWSPRIYHHSVRNSRIHTWTSSELITDEPRVRHAYGNMPRCCMHVIGRYH